MDWYAVVLWLCSLSWDGGYMCEARIATEEQLAFAIFCIEATAEVVGRDPRDVYAALAEKTDLLDTYIAQHYDALHTQDKLYIVEDVLAELAAEGVVI